MNTGIACFVTYNLRKQATVRKQPLSRSVIGKKLFVSRAKTGFSILAHLPTSALPWSLKLSSTYRKKIEKRHFWPYSNEIYCYHFDSSSDLINTFRLILEKNLDTSINTQHNSKDKCYS